MRRFVVEQLAGVIRAYSPGWIVVVVPSSQIGRNVATWIASSGTSHANVSFLTAAGLARSIVDADPTGPPMALADRDERLLAIASSLQRASSATDFYFGGQTGPAFIGSLEQSISALRDANVNASTIGRSPSPKMQSVASILTGYEAELARTGVGDTADLFRVATERIAKRGFRPVAVALCVADEVELGSAATAFLRAFGGPERFRLGAEAYDQDLPQRCASRVLSDWPLVRPQALAAATRSRKAIAPSMPVSGSAESNGAVAAVKLGKGGGSATVRFASAPSPEREIQGALADMLASGCSLDQCELVYTRTDYLPAIEAACLAWDIPATFGQGRPVTGTAPGYALQAFYSWIADGLGVRELEHLLRTRYLKVVLRGEDGKDQFVQPYAVAELLRSTASGRGPEAFERALAGSSDPMAHQSVVNASRALKRLLDIVPTTSGSSIKHLAEAGISLLQDFVWCRCNGDADKSRDNVALQSLVERLRRIGRTDIEMPMSDGARFMSALVGDHRFGTSAAKSGALYVVPLESAGYAGRRHTTIIGLDEHVFPGASNEDPVLLDHERADLSPDMIRRRADPARRLFHLERALLNAGDDVVLVRRRLDLIYGKHIEVSPVIGLLRERLQAKVEPWDLVDPADRALSDTDALLSQRNTAGFAAAVEAAFPWMSNGEEAERLRLEPAINVFTGSLGRRTPELSVRDGQPVSASRLETLATCPYRYYLRHVLRVRPPDDPEIVPGQWLSARELGSLLHELYFKFMTEIAGSGERVEEEKHVARLLDLLDELIAEWQQKRPSPGSAALDADRKRMQRSAMVFLRSESTAEAEPYAFELRFGRNAEEEPLEICLSDDVVLSMSGSIDRVDKTKSGFQIWDYKTGSTRPFQDSDLQSTSEHLQWMLYAYAFETMMRGRDESAPVDRSGYFFVNDREHGRRIFARVPAPGVLADDLRPLFEMVEEGAFLHFQKSGGRTKPDRPVGACTFCDYRDLCFRERRTANDLDDYSVFDRESRVGRALADWLTKGGRG